MTLAVRNWPVITRLNSALNWEKRYLMDNGWIGEGILWQQLGKKNLKCNILSCIASFIDMGRGAAALILGSMNVPHERC